MWYYFSMRSNDDVMENQTPAVPTSVPQIVEEQPKQSNFIVILLSILLLLSVLIAGFFAFQTQKLVKELQGIRNEELITPEPTTEPVATLDPTADWQVYTNSKYDFSFKYPEDWKVTLSPATGEQFNLIADRKNNSSETGFVPVQFSINMSTNDSKITTLAQAEAIYKISNSQTRKDIFIDNKPAVSVTGLVEGSGPGTGRFLSYTFVKLNNEILVIQLGNKDLQTIFDQILSTFKFTN